MVGQQRMRLSETTNILYADIDEWRLVCDCPAPGTDEHSTWLLRLSGTTSHCYADFAESLQLELSLFCDDHPQAVKEMTHWQMHVVSGLNEHNIPLILEGSLLIPATVWFGMKENLLISVRKPEYVMRVKLETREFLDRPSPFDPERNFAVISFSFELHHRKAN
jgi:hypothetical protein